MNITSVFITSFTNTNRTVKIKYSFEGSSEDLANTWAIISRRFLNFIYYRLWCDSGLTGYLQPLTALEFPGNKTYPTHYTLELDNDQYLDYCNMVKEAQDESDF